MILRLVVNFTEVSLMPLVTQKDKGYLRPLTYQLQRLSWWETQLSFTFVQLLTADIMTSTQL